MPRYVVESAIEYGKPVYHVVDSTKGPKDWGRSVVKASHQSTAQEEADLLNKHYADFRVSARR